MEIKVKKFSETAVIPTNGSDEAAGFDMYADVAETVVIQPHETVMIPSNIGLAIPKGYFGAIYARSGLSTRFGLRPSTCVSVIDSDYRGAIGLPIHNDTNYPQSVKPGERVAQIVFQECLNARLKLVDELDETERGSNGFGSTGL